MYFIHDDCAVEVCTGPGLARGLYSARQMRGNFSNGPGQQMRYDFSTGRAEIIAMQAGPVLV